MKTNGDTPRSSENVIFPSVFLSHGSPMTGLLEEPYVDSLRTFWASLLSKPRAIVVVSAHRTKEEDAVDVSSVSQNTMIHDFYGFPRELYEIQWTPPGDVGLAETIASRLKPVGFKVSLGALPLDHGVWVPLRLMNPEADVPVIQVSLPYPGRPEKVLQLGHALAGLRREGVLIIGSGGAVHNLGELNWSGKRGPAYPWAAEFEAWVMDCLTRKDVGSLVHFEDHAPHAERAHPTREHFDPILFTLGGSLPGDRLRLIHQEIQYGTLSMLCFSLEQPRS